MNVLLSFLLILSAQAVKLETGRFNIYQDGKRVGSEEFSVVKRPDGYQVNGRTQLGEMTISSRMDLDAGLNPKYYEYTSRQGTIRVKVANPVSELESIVNGQNTTTDFRLPEGAVILDNNFFHHYLMLLYRITASPSTFAVFVPQDMRMGSATVQSLGNRTYSLEIGDIKLQATTDADGRLLRLAVPEAKVLVER